MQSPQARIVLLMGIVMAVFGTFKYSILLMTIQFISFYIIADTIECKIYGGCIISSWISLLLPTVIFSLFIFDIFNLFAPYKLRLKQHVHKLGKEIKNKFDIK